jgi:fatty acid desaturase
VGADTIRAQELGLAAGEWYHTEVPRETLKALMQRDDAPAIRDTIVWLGLMVVFGTLGALTWGTWWCVPWFVAYGVLYGSASDARWHEAGHGTAFRTAWMNRWVYQIACFFIMRNPTAWRWSHARHHADTIIVGRDPEIGVMRPPDLARVLLNFIGIIDVYAGMTAMVRYSFGRINASEQTYIPAPELHKVVRVARVWMAIYAATIVAALLSQSLLPLMLIGLPRFYGAWHGILVGLLQHGGLAENVLDHRLNTRTVLMNPVSRFLYLDMNYHVEHHMFPMVPYYHLSALHEVIKHDLPAPSPSIFAAYREMVPALLRQLKYEDYFIKRALPPSARPYRDELHHVGMSTT